MFTISQNTTNRIYIQKTLSFEDISELLDGETKSFSFSKGTAIDGTISVYIDGSRTFSWNPIFLSGYVAGIEFNDIIDYGLKIGESEVSMKELVNSIPLLGKYLK